MKSKWSYIKLAVVEIALFCEAFVLTTLINNFVGTGNLFAIDWKFSFQAVILMALIPLTFSLTIGSWEYWYYNLLASLAMSGGIMVPLIQFGAAYALIIGGATFLVFSLESYRSYKIKNILIKFDPNLILRFSVKGILLVFSLLAGMMIILNEQKIKEIDISHTIAIALEEPIRKTVNSQLQQQMQTQISFSGYSAEEVTALLKEYGISPNNEAPLIANTENVNIREIVQKKVDDIISPYKAFVKPLIAVLVFGLFQVYSMVSYAIYGLFVSLLIGIAKRTGFLRKVVVSVEKEDLQF